MALAANERRRSAKVEATSWSQVRSVGRSPVEAFAQPGPPWAGRPRGWLASDRSAVSSWLATGTSLAILLLLLLLLVAILVVVCVGFLWLSAGVRPSQAASAGARAKRCQLPPSSRCSANAVRVSMA
jgi:hypothetical protein